MESGAACGAALVRELCRLGGALQLTAQPGCVRRLRARAVASGEGSSEAILGQLCLPRGRTP
eukprot:8671309-Pyramimonas_sp.AAC.1